MGLFENSHFPYTNFHELNLDKIVDVTKDAKETAEQAETTANATATTVGTFDNRISQTENDIEDALNRIDVVDRKETIHSDQIDRLQEKDTTIEGNISTLQSDLTALSGRVDTNAENIEGVDLNKTYTVVEQGTLDAGVLVATVRQMLPNQSLETVRLYAPTAGSTVVRAVDVPFNTTGVTPAMSGNTVQAAIEELNTSISDGLAELDHQEIEPNGDEYMNYSDSDLDEEYSGVHDDLNYLFRRIVTNIKGMFKTLSKNVYYDNTGDKIALNASYYSGNITGGLTNIYIMIPYNKIVKRFNGYVYGEYQSEANPIDNPNNYSWVLNGSITVRGVNGYILNNVELASSAITAISCVAVESGIQIKLTIPAASGAVNNSPINAWFSGTDPYIEFYT